jgi:7,8-dihydropterin-6-yl-methyl-4-(beta-D-ribofuranosyl)aminobenzene 5'-phosphate synthase
LPGKIVMRLTVLCDNCVGPISGAIGEHGFAALVEPEDGEPLLFDTGQGYSLLHNARRMGKDLSSVLKVVLSHGHYDHAGGLMALLEDGNPREIFAHEAVFRPRYRVKDTGESFSIGMQYSKGEYEAAGACFSLSGDFREIAAGIMLSGEVPRVTPFEVGDQGLFLDCTGRKHDTTPDDQSLVIETAKGLVILLGCCHAGLVNTLEHVADKTGRRDFYAVIGGTHLGFCGNEQFEKTVAVLKRMGIRKLAVSHCTGFAGAVRLSKEMPKEFQSAMIGYTLEV